MTASHPTPDSGEIEACGARVYWWEGEYDGNCELPRGHLEPFHYDGISYYDDDNNNCNYKQENLERLIAAAVQAATSELRATLNNVHFAAKATISATYTDPVSGKTLYNERAVQAAQVELLERLLEHKVAVAHWAQGVETGTGGGLVGVPYVVSAKTIEHELSLLDGERKVGGKS